MHFENEPYVSGRQLLELLTEVMGSLWNVVGSIFKPCENLSGVILTPAGGSRHAECS